MLFPGTHRHPGFIDLTCDAAFQLRMAINSQNSYAENRHSRASIMASAFGLECAANAVMNSLSLPSHLSEDLDRLPLLSKFDLFLKIITPDTHAGLNRGDARVYKVAELVRIRNEFVHSKVTNIDVEMGEPTDVGRAFSLPMEMIPKVWSGTQIPKPSMFWSRIDAKSALSVTTDFLDYFFRLSALDSEKVKEILFQRTYITLGESSVIVESLFDEFATELEWAVSQGFKLGFIDFGKAKS